jgi:dynein heavy chain
MVAFENYYLSSWKSTIEDARNGLKVFLMKKNLAEKTFEINSDPRLLILFQECKWLMRMNIEIPQSAKDLLTQVMKILKTHYNKENLIIFFSFRKRNINTTNQI